MPEMQQTGLLDEFKQQLGEIAKEAAKAPIDWGRQGLPPGIRSGVAQLSDIVLDRYKTGDNTGKTYLRAVGIVQEPLSVEVDGHQEVVRGRQTDIMIGFVARKGKNGEVIPPRIAFMEAMNEVKKLMAPVEVTEQMLSTPGAILNLLAHLKKKKPYFRFSTSRKESREYTDPKTKEKKRSAEGVWQNWYGTKGVENYTPSANGQAGVEDHTGESEDVDQVVDQTEPAQLTPDDIDPMDAGRPQEDEEIDIAVLLVAAQEKDGNAQLKLKELALAAGMSPTDFARASWDDIAVFIETNQPSDADAGAEPVGEEPTEEPAPTPAKGEIWKTVLAKPGSKKDTTVKRSVEVQVLSVDLKAGTVTLQDQETRKPILGADKKPLKFKFSDLEPA
jgi:hypothetical protein